MAVASSQTGRQALDNRGANDRHQSNSMMFSVDGFTGEGGEDVEEFLESVRLSFVPYEVYYRDDQVREKARLLYLSSRLEGKTKKWWKRVDREKRDTWEKATAMMIAEFDIEEEEDITEWTRANTEFTVLEQGGRTDEEYVLHVKALFGVLGNQFGLALASKFIQG